MDYRSPLRSIYVVIKTILSVIIFSISLSQASAQTMRDVWLSMPDTLVPYLDEQNRVDMLDALEVKDGTDVVGKLQETSHIDVLTSQFISVSLNESSTLQMRLLPSDADTLVCVVRTYFAPQAESEITFYNTKWENAVGSYIDTINQDVFFQRPESMSESRFSALVFIYKECLLVRATLDAAEPRLLLRCSSPTITADEQKEFEPALVQISLKWDGKTFN